MFAGGPPPWVAEVFGQAGFAGSPGFGPGFGRGSGPGGPGGMGPGGPGRGRGPRRRRGDVRAAILDVLGVESLNGYQVIQQIAERSGGAWKPSPGSVYPTISQLEDEGLVVAGEETGKKMLSLTEEGRSYVSEHPEEMAAVWAPFEESAEDADDGDHANLRPVIGSVVGAIWQVASTGTPQQQRDAAEILAETRRRLYGLLAEGPLEEPDPGSGPVPGS